MHFSWATGGNEQWLSYWVSPITDLFLYFLFFQWNILATTSCDRSGIRKKKSDFFFFVLPLLQQHEEEAGARGISISATWKPCHSPFIALPQPRETRPFFQVEKRHDFISNLSLPFRAGNWKQSHEESASGGSWMLTRRNIYTEPKSAYSSYLAAFLLYVPFWWVITFDKQQRKPCLVAVSDVQCKHSPVDVDNDTEGFSPAG